MRTIEIPPRSEDTRVIVLCIGLPASGKSTWAKEQVKLEPDRWRRVNRDDLRLMLWNGPWSPVVADEKVVTAIAEAAVRSNLEAGFDVIVDNTNLKARDRKDFHLIAESVGNCVVVEKVFPCTVEEALKRNLRRSGCACVHADVIINKAKRFHVGKDGSFKNIKDSITGYKEPTIGALIQDENLPKIAIFDLDGSMCNISHRNPYDATTCDQDLPNNHVVDLCKMIHSQGIKIMFFSGREERFKDKTRTWLNTYFNQDYELHMRSSGDYRKDSIVKLEMYEQWVKNKFNIIAVVDDRLQVCQLWYRLGLPIFRVGNPNANF